MVKKSMMIVNILIIICMVLMGFYVKVNWSSILTGSIIGSALVSIVRLLKKVICFNGRNNM